MTGGEILFLSHRIPYPPDKGDKIRSWAWLKHLASRFRVHLVCFVDDPRDFMHKDFLSSICETVALVPLAPRWARIKSLTALAAKAPLSFHYFSSSKMKAAIATARARPLIMEFVFSSAMAPFIASPVGGRKRIVDFCDADSEKWVGYAQSAPPILAHVYAREGRLLAKAETRIANWADASFAVSDDEAALFNNKPDLQKRVLPLSNGVDTFYFNPSDVETDKQTRSDVVFVGAMDYRANVEGVLHFVKTVWPRIRDARPDARFAIVGANPVRKVSALDGKNGVHVTGRVADIRPWLADAKVVVVPLRIARGVQNKVLEAMAMAKPVVTSTEAMTGINAPKNAAITAGDAQVMAQEMLSLLNDHSRRELIGDAAREFVIRKFSWDASINKFDAVLAEHGVYSSSSPRQSEKASPPMSATR